MHRSIAWRCAKDERISGFNPGWSPTAGDGDQGFYNSGPFCPNTLFTYLPAEGEPEVTAVELNKSVLNLPINSQEQLTATVLPSYATNKTLYWSSSDETVATVTQNGLVTAISEGTAIITAAATDGSGVVAECRVNVLLPYGDVNGDGLIDVCDLNLVIRIVLGLTTAGENEVYRPRADLNRNNNIDVSDINTIIDLILGRSIVMDRTFTVGDVSFTMVAVHGGMFQMGGSDSEAEASEKPVHPVTVSSYLIGQTLVTQELWTAVMGSNPSYFSGSQMPVESVTWEDCQEFISRLNVLTGEQFRLPTEAEWEFAARGGLMSQGYKYAGGNDLDAVAWYEDNGDHQSHPVGLKEPNELGLYDMSGNVWEWCQDWYGDYSSASQTNPTGPASGTTRVKRGGNAGWYATYCRVSYRTSSKPTSSGNGLGLRLAL